MNLFIKKMKALLIRPKFKGDFQEYTAPPLGLAYLAAVLERENHEVKILDGWVQNLDEELEKTLNNFNPDLIGLTGLTVDIKEAFVLADKIKSLKPEVLLVFGGPHASLAPVETLNEVKSIDVVIRGEGEKTIVNLMDFIDKKKTLNQIKGITFREEGKIKSTENEELIKDLDSLPFPARHLLPMDKYTPSPKEHKHLPGTDIITSRGCPYQCSFC